MASINQSIRIYPGMWQDTKLSVIADQTGMSVAAVFGCLACMMSMSGASENRGKFAVTPVELADTMGIGLKQAEAVIFHVKRFFVSRGWWRHWDALQVKREDRSAARVRKHRGKNQGVTSEKTPKETVTYNADGQSSFLTESVTSQKTLEETTTCDGSSRAPTRVEYNNINYNINNNTPPLDNTSYYLSPPTQEKPKSKRKFIFECEFFRLTQGDVDGIASRYSELRGKTEQLNQFVDWCRANPDKAPKPHSAQAIFRLRKWFAGALDRQKQFDGEDTESGGSRWAC